MVHDVRMEFVGNFTACRYTVFCDLAELPTIGLASLVRGGGGKFPNIDIGVDVLYKTAFSSETSGGHNIKCIMWLIGDDIDHSCDSVRTVKGGCGPLEDLDTFYSTHVNSGKIDIAGDVPGHFFPVYENENIIPFHPVKCHVCSHGSRSETERGIKHDKGILDRGDTAFFYIGSGHYFNGYGRIFQPSVSSSSGYNNLIQVDQR